MTNSENLKADYIDFEHNTQSERKTALMKDRNHELKQFARSFHADWEERFPSFLVGAWLYVEYLTKERRDDLAAELRSVLAENRTDNSLLRCWFDLGAECWEDGLEVRSAFEDFIWIAEDQPENNVEFRLVSSDVGDTELTQFARQLHQDWQILHHDFDGLAHWYIGTLNQPRRTQLKRELVACLEQANNDQDLWNSLTELGAQGWNPRSNIGHSLKRVISMLEE